MQIELLDSYKRLNKAAPISQVIITPEFYGHEIRHKDEDSCHIVSSKNDEEEGANEEPLLNLVVVTHDIAKEQKQ